MEKLKCIVIDDEPLGREIIENFIKDIPFLELKNSFADPVEALYFIQSESLDIIFSDIEMPKINGMDLVKSLVNPPTVIFITAHRDFALDGFEAGAVDYLVKPVRFDRFLKAVNRVKDRISTKAEAKQSDQESRDFIFVKVNGKLVKVHFNDITYIEAYGDFLKIYTGKDVLITHSTMKSFEELLNPAIFMRVQRSFIINIGCIKTFSGNIIELSNGSSVTIAASKKDELFQLLGIH